MAQPQKISRERQVVKLYTLLKLLNHLIILIIEKCLLLRQPQVQMTIFMSLLIGMWLTLLGVLRLGVISALLSDPILSAFVTSSAFLIATSQLQHLLGECAWNLE